LTWRFQKMSYNFRSMRSIRAGRNQLNSVLVGKIHSHYVSENCSWFRSLANINTGLYHLGPVLRRKLHSRYVSQTCLVDTHVRTCASHASSASSSALTVTGPQRLNEILHDMICLSHFLLLEILRDGSGVRGAAKATFSPALRLAWYDW